MLAQLDRATDWLNSEPLTAGGLSGKVVLVDFWTYSCVNWLRTLPYVSAWAEKYENDGLVIVGVHAPEFGFEHDLANVRRAVAELEVTYPVVIDNDFAIWRAFENHYWPAIYLHDREGRLRFHHFGEEAYAETEQAIQQIVGAGEDLVNPKVDGFATAADWANLKTPETYVGYARGERRTDRPTTELELNEWTLDGAWSVQDESAHLDAPQGSIAFRFEGRDVNIVMGGSGGFTVRLDGNPPGDDHGIDTDENGSGTLDEPRMYQLIRQHPTRERTVTITFDTAGARAYSFTFG